MVADLLISTLMHGHGVASRFRRAAVLASLDSRFFLAREHFGVVVFLSRDTGFHSCVFVACRAGGSAKADPFAVGLAGIRHRNECRLLSLCSLTGRMIFNGCF